MALDDEISEKSLNLAARIGKLTADEIKKAVEKLLADLKSGNYPGKGIADSVRKPKTPQQKHGKMTLKRLSKQGEGLSTMELKDPNLQLLYREMKKHNIDFSAVKDGKGRYTLFFKGKDADSMTHAFKQYTQKTVIRANKRTPIQKLLAAAKAAAKALDAGRDKAKSRSKGARDI